MSTLPGVLADLGERFGVGVCVVADRGLVSEANAGVVEGCGFDHVLATRLHRDPTCAEALEASSRPDARMGASPVARLFDVEIAKGRFLYHYDEGAFAYDELLAGRYVLVTSMSRAEASTARVVESYRQLVEIERRFRVLKDFLHLRPVRHWTERRVRGHVAVCVYATVVEALIAAALRDADVRDPEIDEQHLSSERALRELGRVRSVTFDAAGKSVQVVHPSQPTAVPSPGRTRRPHRGLGPRQHPLTHGRPADVVETLPRREPATSSFALTPPNSSLSDCSLKDVLDAATSSPATSSCPDR